MDLMVDLKSFGDPIKQFSDYVSGTVAKPDNKREAKKSTGTRRKSIVISTGARRKSVVLSTGAPKKSIVASTGARRKSVVLSTGAPKKSTVASTGARRKSIVGVRRHSIARRKSAPCAKTCANQRTVPDSWLRVYQADIQRERKLREKKIAERSVRRKSQHFRSQHCLPKSKPNPNAKRNQKSTKDDSLFGAFQGLSLNVTGGTQSSLTSGGDQCKVM
ncbi:uncharacterized protein LOC109616219 [Esox lucius]|uniref:uncharacterized protein LOC109616219 n=1 Tax=Esox lucius TaxID=8010 RepID=UPI0014769547|nr:uncharacterized protein LOC109616219 [Esox lucius]